MEIQRFRKRDGQVWGLAKAADASSSRCLSRQANDQGQVDTLIVDASAFADKQSLPAHWDGRAIILSLKATAQKKLGQAAAALAAALTAAAKASLADELAALALAEAADADADAAEALAAAAVALAPAAAWAASAAV